MNPNSNNPKFYQCGIALVTSPRLRSVWSEYLAKKKKLGRLAKNLRIESQLELMRLDKADEQLI